MICCTKKKEISSIHEIHVSKVQHNIICNSFSSHKQVLNSQEMVFCRVKIYIVAHIFDISKSKFMTKKHYYHTFRGEDCISNLGHLLSQYDILKIILCRLNCVQKMSQYYTTYLSLI